jgi:hypothetical protein
MTEHDWFASTDALELLEHLYPLRGLDSVQPQSRASRLYLLACARRAWGDLPGVCRAVVRVAERIYHNRAAERRLYEEVYPLAEELTHCRGEADRVNRIGRSLVDLGHAESGTVWVESDTDPKSWDGFAHLAYFPFAADTPHYRRVPVELHCTELVREVFPNPFSYSPPLERLWRSETVTQLARHAHATGDFSSLPILADALEEAGCDRADILEHLRSDGPHVRGCWALELVLR